LAKKEKVGSRVSPKFRRPNPRSVVREGFHRSEPTAGCSSRATWWKDGGGRGEKTALSSERGFDRREGPRVTLFVYTALYPVSSRRVKGGARGRRRRRTNRSERSETTTGRAATSTTVPMSECYTTLTIQKEHSSERAA